MYCVLCTVYCVLCTVYCVLCTVYCVLCTVYCVLCTVYCVLCTVYCVLCTVYCVLCTVYCVLCTVYCAKIDQKRELVHFCKLTPPLAGRIPKLQMPVFKSFTSEKVFSKKKSPQNENEAPCFHEVRKNYATSTQQVRKMGLSGAPRIFFFSYFFFWAQH